MQAKENKTNEWKIKLRTLIAMLLSSQREGKGRTKIVDNGFCAVEAKFILFGEWK